ncbi:hypothetical protein KC678_00075 [Candidatus Dojkabacteria bacterium]|uniref:Uncharacterized protein n=1 Tax=Candidatus Dojkabacteria bacterium TaxID=2099670 RepID=A0A955IA80_9BACT|nr:hypothetical protein [Candidatus Dojkabacteria bacterium]
MSNFDEPKDKDPSEVNVLEYPREYFDVQVAFAAKAALLTGISLEESLRQNTALFRRVTGDKNVDNSNAIWDSAIYFGDLCQTLWDAYTKRPDSNYEAHVAEYSELNPDTRKFITCSYDIWKVVNPDGSFDKSIKIHFLPSARGEIGPFQEDYLAERVRNFQLMFEHITKNHPDAKWVESVSWLNNTRGYLSQFPKSFEESLFDVENPGLRGNSIWGQFVDRYGFANQQRVQNFLEKLYKINRDSTWEDLMDCFPKKVRRAKVAIEDFYNHFGIEVQ